MEFKKEETQGSAGSQSGLTYRGIVYRLIQVLILIPEDSDGPKRREICNFASNSILLREQYRNLIVDLMRPNANVRS